MALNPIKPNGFHVTESMLIAPMLWLELSPEIMFRGQRYYRRDKFHVTLLAGRRIIPLLAKHHGIAETAARDLLFQAYLQVVPAWSLGSITPTGEIRYTKKKAKKQSL